MLVGLCFGLGYGLTQRLLDLQLPGLVQWGQSFEVRQPPGTSLESLRLRFGSELNDLRGRLDMQELETETVKPDPLETPEASAPGAAELRQDGAVPNVAPAPPKLPPAPAPGSAPAVEPAAAGSAEVSLPPPVQP